MVIIGPKRLRVNAILELYPSLQIGARQGARGDGGVYESWIILIFTYCTVPAMDLTTMICAFKLETKCSRVRYMQHPLVNIGQFWKLLATSLLPTLPLPLRYNTQKMTVTATQTFRWRWSKKRWFRTGTHLLIFVSLEQITNNHFWYLSYIYVLL